MVKVDSIILLYALRYALKRTTGASQEVSIAITENIQTIKFDDLKRFKDVIEKGMNDTDEANKFVWQRVKNELTDEILERARIGKTK